jgi:hypothetical protein
MQEISILEVLPGNRAIVTTKRRFRVAVQATGEVVDELVCERRARSLVALHNELHPGEVAVAIPYSALLEGGAK